MLSGHILVVLIWGALVCYPRAASAESSLYERNALSNLHYQLPAQATEIDLAGTSQLSYSAWVIKNDNPNSSSTKSMLSTTLVLGYGLSDAVNATVSETSLLHSSTSTFNDNTDALNSTGTSGLSDPTLAVNYRYRGALEGALFANAAFTFSPSSDTRVVANTDEDGNNVRGNTSIAASSDVYLVSGSHEWAFGANVTYFSVGNADSFASTNSYISSPYFTTYARVRYRWHLLPSLFVQPSLYVYFPYTSYLSYANKSPSMDETDQYPIYLSPRLQLGLALGSSVIVQFTGIYTAYTRTYSELAGSTANSFAAHVDQSTGELDLTCAF